MNNRAYQTLIRIETKLETATLEIEKIKKHLDGLPCKENTNTLNLLRRIIYGAIAIILLAFMGQITKPTEVNSSNTKTITKTVK